MIMKAIVFGASGQQGYHLCQLLNLKGYEVHGVIREKTVGQFGFVAYHESEMNDSVRIFKLINNVRPDEIYNLAAMNDVPKSFQYPLLAMDINCGGLLRIIEAVKDIGLDCKVYFASSSEMFGNPIKSPQNESTP